MHKNKVKKLVMGLGAISTVVVPMASLDEIVESKEKSYVSKSSNLLHDNNSKFNLLLQDRPTYLENKPEYEIYIRDIFEDPLVADAVLAKFNWVELDTGKWMATMSDKSISEKGMTFINGFKLPTVLTEISTRAFANDIFQGSLVIPHSVTTINKHAFDSATFSRQLSINKECKNIYEYAFSKAKFLSPDSFTLDEAQALEVLGPHAFDNVILPRGFSLTQQSVISKYSNGDLVPQASWFASSTLNLDFKVPSWMDNSQALSSLSTRFKYDKDKYVWLDGANVVQSDNSKISGGWHLSLDYYSPTSYGNFVRKVFKEDLLGAEKFISAFTWTQESNGNWISTLNGTSLAGVKLPHDFKLPPNLASIANDSLKGTTFTGSLALPRSVKSIGDRAFAQATFNGAFAINSNCISIGEQALLDAKFNNPYSTFSLETNSGLREIHSNAFENVKLPWGFALPGQQLLAKAPLNVFKGATLPPSFRVPQWMNQTVAANIFGQEYKLPDGYGLYSINKYNVKGEPDYGRQYQKFEGVDPVLVHDKIQAQWFVFKLINKVVPSDKITINKWHEPDISIGHQLGYWLANGGVQGDLAAFLAGLFLKPQQVANIQAYLDRMKDFPSDEDYYYNNYDVDPRIGEHPPFDPENPYSEWWNE